MVKAKNFSQFFQIQKKKISGRQVFRKLRTITSPRFRFLICLNIDHLDFEEMLIFLSFNMENETFRNVTCFTSMSKSLGEV